MSIKGFFSKLFNSNKTEQIEQTHQDTEQLKSAARNAVKNAFEKHKQNPSKARHSAPQNIKQKQVQEFSTDSVDFHNPRVREILDEYNKYFFGVFKITPDKYQLKPEQQNMIIQVNDQDFAENLTQSNKLSLSYEHIFLRLVQKEFKNFTGRISLQSGDSKQQHQKNIKALAHKMAVKVKKTGQKITIPAKSSYERSIIHQVVSKFPGLASKSIGPHHQRKLIIYSVSARQHAQKSNSPHIHE